MTPLPKNMGVIYMNKITGGEGIIFMSKKSVLAEPPGGGGGGGEDTGHVWSVVNYYGFYGSTDFTTTWNETVGNYTGAEGLLYMPGVNYVKVVPTSGYLTYTTGSVYMGALGCKTAVAYKSAGTGGSTQATMTTYCFIGGCGKRMERYSGDSATWRR